MRGKFVLLAGICASAFSVPAFAQEGAAEAVSGDDAPIIVTAQRSNEKLQNVPIAVSAFTAESLDKQQIKTTSDLQLTLPNVTFTKTNFTGSSFTIRGIGDLCVGTTCDSATAIHMNDAPLFSTRLFEGEFYDLKQIEVLRGPQGTLFGRNATSGVVNFRTATPDLTGIHASLEGDYGNYDSKKIKGMVNLPLGSTLGVRVAGFYLKRDGYTTNLFDGSKIDNRDMYGVRGSLRWEPTSSTTIDIMGQYFHERDNRLRIQKTLCQRDPTGVAGCLNGYRSNGGLLNGNSTFTGVLTSKEFLATQFGGTSPLVGLALGSVYGPDVYAGVANPDDPRTINSDYTPQYFSRETIIQGSINQELGNGLSFKLQGQYQDVVVDSSQDYNNSVQNRAVIQGGLNVLGALSAAPGLSTFFGPIAKALIPNGPAGALCTSLPEETGTGSYGGFSRCANTPLDFDRSDQFNKSYSVEGIISSKWDGPFNFLLGGIYAHYKLRENSYYVNAFSIDYVTGILGAATALGRTTAGLATPPGYLGTPFFRNTTNDLRINSYGIFGEANYKFSDQVKLTVGLRLNHDSKRVSARSTLASFFVPIGTANAFDTQFGAGFDADPTTVCAKTGSTIAGAIGSVPGCEAYAVNSVKFTRGTGRAVLDWQITPRNLLYISYSRGYKSGGINPPLQPIFTVPVTFGPETVNAFEIGSKNQFGALQLNATAFYYKYKDLQLSRIVARTSVNDNVSAEIYGAELEAVMRPVRELTINANFSYLHTRVSSDKFLSNPLDFTGGRSDSVLIKDITNGANCAVTPTTAGNGAATTAFVTTANNLINAGAIPGLQAGAGLKGPTAFPSDANINSPGAFSICGVLTALAPTVGAAVGGVQVFSSGVPINIKGNQLPGAPSYKASAGVQYEIPVGGGWTMTPRFDAILTGSSYGSIFTSNVNRIPSYTQYNAQIELDGPDKKYFIRGYIQNIANSNAITGLYVTDQSSGNYTNIFTLDPRRYGVAAGVKF